MTTTTIETRTAEITAALKALTSKSTITTHDLPEVIQRSAIAGAEDVRRAIYISCPGLPLEKIARFFATVYTEEDVHTFLAAYAAAAPEGYNQDDDLKTSAPWCCPWLTGAMGASEEDTPETLGRKAACMDYAELESFFGHGDGLAARTEAAIRGYLLDGNRLPEFLKPEEDTLSRAAADIAEAKNRFLDDEERERLTSEIVRNCIDTITPRVAEREGR